MVLLRIKNLLSNQVIALVLIGLVAGVMYSNIYRCPFVFDDMVWIVQGELIKDLSNFATFRELFRPRGLVYATLAVNYKLGGLSVFGYHLFNVLVHVTNGVLVYFLCRILFRRVKELTLQALGPQFEHLKPPKKRKSAQHFDVSGTERHHQLLDSEFSPQRFSVFQSPFSIPLMSLLAALIFIAHPIQTQAVTYTIQRLASMSTMFYLASVLFFLKARTLQARGKDRGPGADFRAKSQHFQILSFYSLMGLSGILALLSKQNAASLPLAILVIEYLFFDRTLHGWKRKLVWIVPAGLLFGGMLLYLAGFFRGEFHLGALLEDVSNRLRDPGSSVSRWSYFCTQFSVLVIYIRLLFFPINQSLDHFYAFKTGFLDGYTPLAFLFLTFVVAIGFWGIRKRPIMSLGIFWFFITLSVESSIIPISDAMFEHRLYLPMFGFSLIAAHLVFQVLSKKENWAIVLSAAIILSLGTATYFRNKVWQSSISLWADVLAKNPKNYWAHVGLGLALHERGIKDKALAHLFKAIELRPGCSECHYNLAVALERQRKLEEASKHYREVLRINPDNSEARYNLVVLLIRQERIQEAISEYNYAVKAKQPRTMETRKIQSALSFYCQKMQLFLPPDDWKGHYDLAMALAFQGDHQGAVTHYQKVLDVNPGHAEAHNNLGSILASLQKTEEAISHFSEAIRLKPGYEEAQRNLERALLFMETKSQGVHK